MIASRSFARRASGLLLASTAFLGTGAYAQDTAAPQQQPAAQQDADGEVIVVTATKRAENLQDVPIAITAITTKTLDDLQVNDFND